MRIVLLITGWLLAQAAYSQSPAGFMILKTEGRTAYKKNGTMVPLRIGTSLSANDVINLYGKATVTVICNNYSSFTFTSAATDKTRQFGLGNYKDSCGKQKNNHSAAFLKYVWTHLREEKEGINDTEKKHLNELGAVTRGCGDMAFEAIPDIIAIYNKTFGIRYPRKDTASTAVLMVFEAQESAAPVFKRQLKTNSIAIDKELISKLKTGKVYYYTVSINGMENCGRKRIYRISTDEYNRILSAQKDASFVKLNGIDKTNVMIALFEQNHIVAEQYAYIKKTAPKDESIGKTKRDLEALFVF